MCILGLFIFSFFCYAMEDGQAPKKQKVEIIKTPADLTKFIFLEGGKPTNYSKTCATLDNRDFFKELGFDVDMAAKRLRSTSFENGMYLSRDKAMKYKNAGAWVESHYDIVQNNKEKFYWRNIKIDYEKRSFIFSLDEREKIEMKDEALFEEFYLKVVDRVGALPCVNDGYDFSIKKPLELKRHIVGYAFDHQRSAAVIYAYLRMMILRKINNQWCLVTKYIFTPEAETYTAFAEDDLCADIKWKEGGKKFAFNSNASCVAMINADGSVRIFSLEDIKS